MTNKVICEWFGDWWCIGVFELRDGKNYKGPLRSLILNCQVEALKLKEAKQVKEKDHWIPLSKAGLTS